MARENEVEGAILDHLATHGSCSMEDLARKLSAYTLNRVFFAVDRLSRNGQLILRRPRPLEYCVSSIALGLQPERTHKEIAPGS